MLDKLGEFNPQLLREIKGRCKKLHILPTITISFLIQLGIFLYFQSLLPNQYKTYANKYCTGGIQSGITQCLFDSRGNELINWQLWFHEIFGLLSLVMIFVLIIGGSYLLISDLATEKRRDTLNFVRLSPQSPQSILIGKILGVPILLYLGVLLAIPGHLWLGINAGIPFSIILSFYVILIASSVFYYSISLLFSLVFTWLWGFQAWLGSGLILGFFVFTQQALNYGALINYPFVIFKLVNPYFFIPYFAFGSLFTSQSSSFAEFKWFGIRLGTSFLATVGFTLLVYFLGTYFIWQSLERCYLDPHTTMLSKKQSYLLTTSFAIVTLGCANWQELVFSERYNSSLMTENIACLMGLDFWLFFFLIVALTPNRQKLQDWTRFRYIPSSQLLINKKLTKDLIWGEKSPGLIAIAINAIIASACLEFFVAVTPNNSGYKVLTLISLVFATSLVVIYAALVQLFLFMKNGQRIFWALGIVGTLIILPPIILITFFGYPGVHNIVWLFSVAAPLVTLYSTEGYISLTSILLGLIGHGVILSVLLWKLNDQLKKAGASASKALMAN
ncbi:hypothetical protein [Nostoc sp. TCL26-01]|uniref:hypothetical protein n=1 Tax=Nostoc sp. TCL26-01 TaxID=2576904 RepID=UPI0015B9723E|nr:hypothetical protein [Nostoc sp. TCL26-01]QLE57857.1 hypothetical protein FD725_21460 [Nostoc sp. TCL26-01]